MSDRVKLKVLGISYTQLQSGAFALLLSQEDGPYRIPVVVGSAEAQAIAIRMESIIPPRPLTHDLFVSFAQAFGVRLLEVFIYKFENGIFSSELTFSDGEREVTLDARTSDAIAIAMRCRAPIYTTREILEETGFIIENDPTYHPEEGDEPAPEAGDEDEDEADIEKLEERLASLIEEENYEEAARVSKIIKRRRGDEDNATASGDETENQP